MSKYLLKADYENDQITYIKQDDLITVNVPMLENNKLKYGLNAILTKMKKKKVFPSEKGFDIISLATIVYLADTRISRNKHGQDSWTREISIELPVSNINIWNNQIDVLERMLKFLTGDIWHIHFTERKWLLNTTSKKQNKTESYTCASLFSGGMDSLISTINLMQEGKNTLLISHAGESLTKNAQNNIIDKLDDAYPSYLHDIMNLWMVFPSNYIPYGENDNNTRSRSFLFIAFGIFVLTGVNNVNELLVPENGLIALNVPLDVTRVGSFSTRTTHPFYLNKWNELLSGLSINLTVRNPYWNKTKGEMAYECKNKDVLIETMKLSFSCSSPNKSRWQKKPAQHCGYCVPCLIRRAAMYKAFRQDVTTYTVTSIKAMQKNSNNSNGVQLRSFQYAINKLKKHEGNEKLYIHKSGPLSSNIEYLNELADTYKRGLFEVDTFIEDSLEQEG